MIKNIIFDLGNVLIEFNPYSFVEKNIPEEDRDEVFHMIFQRKEWLELDRGTLSYDEVVKFFATRFPQYEKQIRNFFENKIIDCLKPIEENIKIVEILKKRDYKLYILSNFHYPAFKNISEKWEFFKFFDGQVISSHANLLKPEKEIYEEILGKYKLVPKETLFIDDSLENIEAGKKFGLHTIHLDNYKELKKKLEEISLI
ncbi:MAG: HAD family hydrolase [Fusobacteriaceae bacterium]